jgi:steroid 5-alpha reductase family enzyme
MDNDGPGSDEVNHIVANFVSILWSIRIAVDLANKALENGDVPRASITLMELSEHMRISVDKLKESCK